MLRRRSNRDRNLSIAKETIQHDQQSQDAIASTGVIEEESLVVISKTESADKKQTIIKRRRVSSKTVELNDEDDDDDALEDKVLGGDLRSVRKVLGEDEHASSGSGDSGSESESGRSDDDDDDGAPEEVSSKRPVWVDDDDVVDVVLPKHQRLQHLQRSTDAGVIAGDQYTARLHQQFERVAGLRPAWADSGDDKTKGKKREGTESDEEADSAELELTRSTGKYLTKSRVLPRHNIAFKRLRDPTFGHRSKKPLNSIEFHPQTKVLLAAGDGGKATLFKIDGDENPLLQSANFERFPIKTAHFSADGAKVFVASAAQEYFHSYDLMSANIVQILAPKGIKRQRLSKFEVSPDGQYLAFCGKYGEIHLLSAKSMEWVKTMKMAGEVAAMAFSPSDPTLLYTYGDVGQVHIWDVAQRECLHRFQDDGAVRGVSITVSKDGRYIATGSNTGIVNLYETAAVHKSAEPKPIKAIANLTTSADFVRFSGDSELLAIASSIKDNAVRLVHTRSCGVFSNFPEKAAHMRHPLAVDFSPNGGYMSVGNDKGQAMLFRLHHFESY